MRDFQLIIYGSYGYTGQLIVDECRSQNLSVLLSGRNARALEQQSKTSGYPFQVADTANPYALSELAVRAYVVIHCGGPFRHTARSMVEACIRTGTTYTDITGEYEVFEHLAGYDQEAKAAGIVVMPGVGFDVVPSDCLAVHLSCQIANPTCLQLAFAMSGGGMSRGTMKTAVEGLGKGTMVRRNGILTPLPSDRTMEVNFGPFSSTALCIPWGDISTAWRSTQIPNIEVYAALPPRMISIAKATRYIGPILRNSFVRNFIRKRIESMAPGPDENRRNSGSSYLWGRVQNTEGQSAEARLKTASGYLLTARTSVEIARRLLSSPVKTGYHTPAAYFGESIITSVEGTTWLR